MQGAYVDAVPTRTIRRVPAGLASRVCFHCDDLVCIYSACMPAFIRQAQVARGCSSCHVCQQDELSRSRAPQQARTWRCSATPAAARRHSVPHAEPWSAHTPHPRTRHPQGGAQHLMTMSTGTYGGQRGRSWSLALPYRFLALLPPELHYTLVRHVTLILIIPGSHTHTN